MRSRTHAHTRVNVYTIRTYIDATCELIVLAHETLDLAAVFFFFVLLHRCCCIYASKIIVLNIIYSMIIMFFFWIRADRP